MGRGWNQDYFSDTDQLPSRWDLDKACADVPVCAVRACGHCLTVNSKALEVLGVTAESPQPEGGRIGMENGQPDGRFYDNAMEMVYDAIPVPDKEALKGMIRAACKALNAYGVTSSQTDDYCVFRKVPWETVNAAYQELEAAGELTVRVYEQSNFTDLPSLRGFVEAGCRTGVGTDRFKIGPLKMLGDGALGPHTAYLSRPYADDASTCGIPVFTQETMDEMIGYANEQGMQAAVHAIGDACLDNVISAYEKALAEHPRKDHRHGVVHCQIMRPDQMEKIEALGLHIYAQTIFLDYDSRVVETRVGKELASTSYAWKSLMKRGGVREQRNRLPGGASRCNGVYSVRRDPDAPAGRHSSVSAGGGVYGSGGVGQLYHSRCKGQFRGEPQGPHSAGYAGGFCGVGAESL